MPTEPHLAADSEAAARLVMERLDSAVRMLAEMPIGRPGRVFGTYEKYVRKTSLIIAYELVGEDTLGILHIIHAKRNWPEGQWPEDADD